MCLQRREHFAVFDSLGRTCSMKQAGFRACPRRLCRRESQLSRAQIASLQAYGVLARYLEACSRPIVHSAENPVPRKMDRKAHGKLALRPPWTANRTKPHVVVFSSDNRET
jgi:hypothetical protein